MLNVTDINKFYYIRDFTDMRCKYDRALSIIREQLHREPERGGVFIVMSRNRRLIRMFMYDRSSCSLFEKKFRVGYQYGSKSQNAKAEVPSQDADRTRGKDDFYGTVGSVETEVTESPSPMPTPKKRDLSNCPDTYSRMGIEGGTTKNHFTDRSKVPGRIIESDTPKMIRVFSLKMSLVEERFELVHYVPKGGKPRWGYFPKEGHPQFVTKFDGTKATPEFMQAIAMKCT